jgi:hypothetical protein
MKSRIIAFCQVVLCVVLPGCVSVHSHGPHKEWPQAIAVTELSKFSGTFEDRSRSWNDNSVQVDGESLYKTLGGFAGPEKATVQIVASATGGSLHVALWSKEHRELGHRDLVLGTDFVFSDGVITLRGPNQGWGAGGFGLGVGFGYNSIKIFVSSNGGLLGKDSGGAAGLALLIVPAGGSGVDWRYWPCTSH